MADRAVQLLLDAEDLHQFLRQPDAGRRAAEEVEVVGERLPDFAVVGLDRPAIPPRHAQRLQRHALRVEHAKDVVVGDDQQIGRAAEGVVRVGEHARIDMAVRADQR